MNNNQIIAIVLVVGVIITFAAIFFMTSGSSENDISDEPQKDVLVEEDILPTVDSSVAVSMTLSNDGREIEFGVENIPNGTNSVEYEMSYQTEGQGLQGLIGEIELEPGENAIEKMITAGTCSSGKCVYHEITSDIEVLLKFNGEYGERIYENSFTL